MLCCDEVSKAGPSTTGEVIRAQQKGKITSFDLLPMLLVTCQCWCPFGLQIIILGVDPISQAKNHFRVSLQCPKAISISPQLSFDMEKLCLVGFRRSSWRKFRWDPSQLIIHSLLGKLKRSVKPQSRLFSGLFPLVFPVVIPPCEHHLVALYQHSAR